MTRTVEQARLWPMPGDAWIKESYFMELIESVCHGKWIYLTFGNDYSCSLEYFREWVADATPVRVFEGEG